MVSGWSKKTAKVKFIRLGWKPSCNIYMVLPTLLISDEVGLEQHLGIPSSEAHIIFQGLTINTDKRKKFELCGQIIPQPLETWTKYGLGKIKIVQGVNNDVSFMLKRSNSSAGNDVMVVFFFFRKCNLKSLRFFSFFFHHLENCLPMLQKITPVPSPKYPQCCYCGAPFGKMKL